jgi:hypothetical protein
MASHSLTGKGTEGLGPVENILAMCLAPQSEKTTLGYCKTIIGYEIKTARNSFGQFCLYICNNYWVIYIILQKHLQ